MRRFYAQARYSSRRKLCAKPNRRQRAAPGAGAIQARRPFSNLNSYTTIRWDGWAAFNGLTVAANHRFSHGLSFGASYMWSRSIDDASDAGTTNVGFNLPQNIYARPPLFNFESRPWGVQFRH